MRKKVISCILLLCLTTLFVLACAQQEKEVTQKEEVVKNIKPSKKEGGGKYRIAYVDYDDYLPAREQLYYILSGLKSMGWITCEGFPFQENNMSTEEMIHALAEMDLGEYIEFCEDAFYYLDYDGEEAVQEGLYYHAVEKKDIDLILVFGTSAGKLVKDMNLPIPMVDFSATDPVASGIIDSSAEGSGRDNVWAQVEPSMPLRQLKYYHSIKPFDRLGIVVYGDETVSGVPDIEKAAREVGFELVKYDFPEVSRETEEELEKYYKTVQQKFRELCMEDIDAFFLTVGLINDLERLPECLSVFYEKKIPVYVMDDINTVKNGALLIISTYDFENVGYFIADAMAQILNGAVAGNLPCVYTSSPYICLNYEVAKQISYPLDIKFLMACDEIYTEKETD